jgi:hypothetical protein
MMIACRRERHALRGARQKRADEVDGRLRYTLMMPLAAFLDAFDVEVYTYYR